LKVQVPANTTATIYLPAVKNSIIKQDGKNIKAKYADGRAIVKIGSGKYIFKVNN